MVVAIYVLKLDRRIVLVWSAGIPWTQFCVRALLMCALARFDVHTHVRFDVRLYVRFDVRLMCGLMCGLMCILAASLAAFW